MENFIFYNPTKILFGVNQVDKIGSEAKLYGSKALIILGGSSAKKNGLYARVLSSLNASNISVVTYEGVKSNPLFEDADDAVKLAKEENVNMIIAVGGGSVIDTAKAVAIGFYADHSVWDFYLQKQKPSNALPLLNVLTLAATGTEMNSSTVLQDTTGGMKKGYSSPFLFPKVSILDPVLTYTVPLNYTAYGISDLISHCLEVYFGKSESPLSDHYIASILKLAVKYGLRVMDEPENYEARANIMWLATNALNGTLTNGKGHGDWACHGFEHSLSVLYNIAHGAGLSIVYPAWLKHFSPQIIDKLAFLGKMVFDLDDKDPQRAAQGFINQLEQFFISIKTPVRLSDVNISEDDRSKIIENLQLNKVSGRVYEMELKDYESMLDYMWK